VVEGLAEGFVCVFVGAAWGAPEPVWLEVSGAFCGGAVLGTGAGGGTELTGGCGGIVD
jgi:hypothetical protein